MTDRLIALFILCLVLSVPFGIVLLFTGEMLLNFVFFWPLFMSGIWIAGGIYFWLHRERHWRWSPDLPAPAIPANLSTRVVIPYVYQGRAADDTS